MGGDTGDKEEVKPKKEVKRLPYSRERTVKLIKEGAQKLPEKVRPYVEATALPIALIGQLLWAMEPLLNKAWVKMGQLWEALQPYHPEDALPAVFGLLLCFFGGTFLATIAAFEAFRASAWDETKNSLKVVYDNYQKGIAASKKDDAVDQDGDGIADVDQIDPSKYVMRKLNLMMISVEPDELLKALGVLYGGFLAVVATLRIQFARAVTLGNSIGEIVSTPARKFISPHIEGVVPASYKKWVSPLIHMVCKFIAISVAYMVQRVISSVHSAIRGGQLFSRGTLSYLSKMGYVHINHEETYLDEAVGLVVGVLGLAFQITYRWTVPFPFNIIMIPVWITERALMWNIGSF